MKRIPTLEQIANLIEERDIIDHGTIRMLWSRNAAKGIADAEGISSDDIGDGTIGDDDLAECIRDLDGYDAWVYRLAIIASDAWRGDDLQGYIEPDSEDELRRLEALIERADHLLERANSLIGLTDDDIQNSIGDDYGLTVSSDTEEEWDYDKNGKPTCSTLTTISLHHEGDVILTGTVEGYYSFCRVGGDQFYDWQDEDGPDVSRDAMLIGALMDRFRDYWEYAEYIDAPSKPENPDDEE